MSGILWALQRYRIKDKPLYSVTPVSGSKLGGEFKLPPFFGCGKWLERLQSVILWLGDYETKSVLHNDDVDGMMCLLSGKKRWYYIDKRHYTKVQSKACGWNVADESGRGYGEFVRMKVDNVRPSLHACYNSTECGSSRPPARGMAWRGVLLPTSPSVGCVHPHPICLER